MTYLDVVRVVKALTVGNKQIWTKASEKDRSLGILAHGNYLGKFYTLTETELIIKQEGWETIHIYADRGYAQVLAELAQIIGEKSVSNDELAKYKAGFELLLPLINRNVMVHALPELIGIGFTAEELST